MRDVAVVAFAQTVHTGHDAGLNEAEMLLPVLQEVRRASGLDAFGFTCSGSCDYLAGAPFSFVSALDALGAWPPISESHVEMDGAFALYEAWVRLQHGDVDSALVFGFGKSSMTDVRELMTLQLDPYYLAPLGLDQVSFAALQASARGADRAALDEIVRRSRTDGRANPYALDLPDPSGDAFEVEPLRPYDIAPVTDGAAAVVLAAGDLARELAERPAWITGIAHRIEPHYLGMRDLAVSVSAAEAARAAGVGKGRVDVAELHTQFSHEEPILREALGLPDGTVVNPSGGPLAANPIMATGLIRVGEAARRILDGTAARAVAHATSGPCLQHNLVAVLEALDRDEVTDVGNRCAVIGVGQTHYRTKRRDVSIAGLVREAALRALEDADLTFADIDAVVIGKAPDLFEGVMMPEAYLADALGAAGKPMMRVHTAGSVGGSTALVGASLIQAGVHDRVLVVAFEKQSESNATWALSTHLPFGASLVVGAGGYFAPHIREYMRRSGAPGHIGSLVAVKDRRNALKNPYAHLKIPGISREMVESTPMLWEPIRYLETCPSSDGACAIVLAAEDKVTGTPAWVHGTAMRSEPIFRAGRDTASPQAGKDCAADVYRQAGVGDPRRDIDVAEVYVPFSWYEPMWLENLGFAAEGEGWKLTEAGCTALDGDIPWNASGGVLSSNPIGASGLIRFAEAALQVRGMAGEHQVDGARLALGHAYGGGAQFFAMWIVGSRKP